MRKWESVGGDEEVLWGLAKGSGKDPYQTRVSLTDLASKCSCPSRKFPCKHALGLMFLATGEPAALVKMERPPWVSEWIDARANREQKAADRATDKAEKPVDEKAALKRREQRENRMRDGVELLDKAILDLVREGLASGTSRNAGMWEDLAKRMIDSQVPGLAGLVRQIPETILRSPEVDCELPMELGRLHLLSRTYLRTELEGAAKAEVTALLGDKPEGDSGVESIDDQWIVTGKATWERDRLVTSATWLLGSRTSDGRGSCDSHRWPKRWRIRGRQGRV